MKTYTLLLVDDDPYIQKALECASPDNWSLELATNFNKPLSALKTYHAAFIDLHLSGNTEIAEGLDVIKNIKTRRPHIDIIAISGNFNRELMESCLDSGAQRFLSKPLNPEEIKNLLAKIEAYYLLKDATDRGLNNKSIWVGTSSQSISIKKQVSNLRGESGPILIEGESGTGKEIIADMIHQQEPYAPFIKINVAAIPENLFESEFFGHLKGSFTGASQNKMGLAEAANGGDLFIDEIEALSLPLQVKLLRFLESGEVRRIGAKESVMVNARVILATNENLEDLVEKEKFRKDLLWRINGKKITLPPLRARPEDIEPLCHHFLSHKYKSKQLDPDALMVLKSHLWPGNVRELKRVCERLMLSSPLPILRAQDVYDALESKLKNKSGAQLSCLNDELQVFEKKLLIEALTKYNDVEQTAEVLQISRSSLYKKIKDYNISWRAH